MATSTPRPSVIAITFSFQLAWLECTDAVAPNFRASSAQCGSRSMAMLFDGPYARTQAVASVQLHIARGPSGLIGGTSTTCDRRGSGSLPFSFLLHPPQRSGTTSTTALTNSGASNSRL